MKRSRIWIATGSAVLLVVFTVLLSYRDAASSPVTVAYFETHRGKDGTNEAWVRITNPGSRPITYSILSRERNANGHWELAKSPVLGRGVIHGRSAAESPIPVETLGIPWRVKVAYKHRTRGLRGLAHRCDELYERVRGKRVSVRYETNAHTATSEAFLPSYATAASR